MKHNCSSLGLEFGILYFRKDPNFLCYMGGRKAYTVSSPTKVGGGLGAVEFSAVLIPEVRIFLLFPCFISCQPVRWERWLPQDEGILSQRCQQDVGRFSWPAGTVLTLERKAWLHCFTGTSFVGICSFSKSHWVPAYVPGIVLGAGDTVGTYFLLLV